MDAPKSKKPSQNERVQVVVRCRPMSDKELSTDNKTLEIWPRRGVVELYNRKEEDNWKTFSFDAVYDSTSSQQSLYDENVRPLVSSVLDGFNGCVFAYGQTGTGKTYTMVGDLKDSNLHGMMPRVFDQIWTHIRRSQNAEFLVLVTFLEIYKEEIRDLLRPQQARVLEVRERDGFGVHVPHLRKVCCKTQEDMTKVMEIGNRNRIVGATNMNDRSSRSHAIFQISFEACTMTDDSVKAGKLSLIDLAGSERQSKTGACDDRLKESTKINRSLSSLGNVINALSEDCTHIPYRDSKLTRLLQDCLGGNSKTLMVANIGPASANYEETLTTLRYANRAKRIHNRPVKNHDPKAAKMREYQAEIARLKALLAERKARPPSSTDSTEDETHDPAARLELEKSETEELARKLHCLEKQLVKGGRNIIDAMVDTELQLERQQAQMVAMKRREVEMQQRLELEAETTTELRDSFCSLQHEVDYKSRRLTDLHAKWFQVRRDVKDTRKEHAREVRDAMEYEQEVLKDLQLHCLLVDSFVPTEDQEKLFADSCYDDDRDDWILEPPSRPMERPRVRPEGRRPTTRFAMVLAKRSNATRYRAENVVDLRLDLPEKKTRRRRAPRISPFAKGSLQDLLNKERAAKVVEVLEPPPSFQPRRFPRRELERRHKRAVDTTTVLSSDPCYAPPTKELARRYSTMALGIHKLCRK